MPEPGVAPLEPVVLKADRAKLKVAGFAAVALGVGVGALAALDSGGPNVLIMICGATFAVVGTYIVWRGFFSGDPLAFSTEGMAPYGQEPIPWEQIEGLFLYHQTSGYGTGTLSLGLKLDTSGSWWTAKKTPLLQMASGASGYEYTVPLTAVSGYRGDALINVIRENSPVALVDTRQ